MTLCLEHVETGRIHPLVPGRSLVIGRGSGADIDLESRFVSRRHCEIHWDGCRVTMTELVGGGRTAIVSGDFPRSACTGGLLRLGDVLRLGMPHLRLCVSPRVDPAWRTWHGGLIVVMTLGMYENLDFDDMPMLADALEEAGCRDPEMLAHGRQQGAAHALGCWLLDAMIDVLRKPAR
jgi:hypothetical protein